jgi:hypothetical protein
VTHLQPVDADSISASIQAQLTTKLVTRMNGYSRKEIVETVEMHLPKWKQACLDETSSFVTLSQSAFSNTVWDMHLLAVAIKYAKIVKKNVTVVA